MPNLPHWFDENEYADFLAESSNLWEMINIPYQKQKIENRKKMANFEREKALQRGRLKSELVRDLYRKKAQGIQQMQMRESIFGSTVQNIHDDFLLSLLSEAETRKSPIKAEKNRMRPEVDPRRRERDRKRESRRQEKQAGLSNIIIVKNNKLNKIEIITKADFKKESHTLLKGKVKGTDKGNVTKRDLSHYSSLDNFMNTKTSVKLLGGRVERKKEEKNKKQSSQRTEETSERQAPQQIPPPRPRVPQNGKEMTDSTSTYPEWDHTTNQVIMGVDDALNSFTGRPPSPEYQQFVSTSRTYGDAMSRFSKEIFAAFPQAAGMVFTKMEPVMRTGEQWQQLGIPAAEPAATIVGQSEQGPIGISVKIGQQIRATGKGEMGPILNMIIGSEPSKPIIGSFDIFVKDFIEELKKTFSSQAVPFAIRTDRESSNALAREKWKAESIENTKNTFLNRAGDLVERYINENYDLKASILLEALTGNMKFDGELGSAQVMFTAKKDGTNARAIPLDYNFALRLAKSKDTDLNLKYIKTPNSSNGFLQNMLSKINPLMENNLTAVSDLESVKNQISTPTEFLQLFELQIADATYATPIEYGDFYNGDSDVSNIIIFNQNTSSEEQISIPVQKNYDPQGEEDNVIEKGADALLEQYLYFNDILVENVKCGNIEMLEALLMMENAFGLTEDRNYRKEYDNYHSKKKQRKNRSKRVLARRKMMKKGKVHKGDGKDVDHKDGNPQNNNYNNLRVLSKSKNRSMNEDHGAGFEGTPEALEKLIRDTPGADPSIIKTDSAPYLEAQLDKKKRKK